VAAPATELGSASYPFAVFPEVKGNVSNMGTGLPATEGSPPSRPGRPVPQPVLSPLTESAIFLVVTIDGGREAAARDLLRDLAALQRTVGFRVPDGRLAVVAGIGANAWGRLYPGPRPARLHPFRALQGAEHRAVSTPGDLLFHIRARQMDLCFELATQLMDRLGSAVTVVDEVHGFKYFEVRDLLGFVDGTENPVGPDATVAVTVGEEDQPFAGSSYVVVQKYLHDLQAWNGLSVEDQERVIGRTKLSNVELPDDVKPANSHVALTTIVAPDGEERDIVRDNMPFGSIGNAEFGTYFIGYASTPDILEQMLERMFIGDPPGNCDRILDFSTAVTGSLFFVPTIDFLEDPPAATDPAAPTALRLPTDPSWSTESGDGSLGIGGLRCTDPA
jgi:porphyrinogen peroxidase